MKEGYDMENENPTKTKRVRNKITTLEQIEELESEVITAEIVAQIVHISRETITKMARGSEEERTRLGFKVIVTSGGRVLIPKRAFIAFMKGTMY